MARVHRLEILFLLALSMPAAIQRYLIILYVCGIPRRAAELFFSLMRHHRLAELSTFHLRCEIEINAVSSAVGRDRGSGEARGDVRGPIVAPDDWYRELHTLTQSTRPQQWRRRGLGGWADEDVHIRCVTTGSMRPRHALFPKYIQLSVTRTLH